MSDIKKQILKHFEGIKVIEINSLLNKFYAKGVTEGRRREKNKSDQPTVNTSFSDFLEWARQADLWEGYGDSALLDDFKKYNERKKK